MSSVNTVNPAPATEAGEPKKSGLYFRPLVDIVESKDELLILADMPGVDPQRIDVNFEDGTLSIRGQVESREPGKSAPREQEQNLLLHEYGVGEFYREFRLNEQIDAQRITADYAQGVLTLHLPKAESAKPRKISVQAK